MENISIKKVDNTTTVTLVAKRPASSTEPALYLVDAASAIPAERPSLSVSGRKSNANAKTQNLTFHTNYPIYKTDTAGNKILVANIPVTTTHVIPATVAEADVKEAINFHHAAALASLTMIASGFPPRS